MELFSGGPRMATLIDVYRKRNRENEERVLLEFAIPISPEVYSTAPDNVKAAFDFISDLSHGATRLEIAAEIEGVRLEIYELPEHKKKKILGGLIESCTLRSLRVSRPSKDTTELHEGDVHFSFSTTVAYDSSLRAFAGRLFDKTVFVHFSNGQMRLISEPKEEDDSQPKLIDDGMPTMRAANKAAVEASPN